MLARGWQLKYMGHTGMCRWSVKISHFKKKKSCTMDPQVWISFSAEKSLDMGTNALLQSSLMGQFHTF